MNVYPLFGLLIFVALSSVLIKLITNNLPRAKALFVQYLFAALFISLFWLFSDGSLPSARVFLTIAGGLAFLNYLGAYCLWSAYKIDMGRTSLFFPWVGLLAIALYCIFLDEHKNLKPLAIIGVCLHIVALYLFYAGRAVEKKFHTFSQKVWNKEENFWKWLLFTLGMVVLNGLIVFWMKVLSFDVSKTHFLLCWYVGTLVFSSFVLFFEKEKTEPSKRKLFYFLPLLSLTILLGLTSLYWAFQLNSGSLVVSFNALNLTFVPILASWFFFGEKKGLNKIELMGFLCGAVAATLIILSH